MLRNAAVDLIMSRLGNRKDVALRDSIITEMNFVQVNILEEMDLVPQFLLTEEATAVNDSGDKRLPIPTDFLMEWEDGGLYRFDAASTDDPWKEMVKDDYDVLLRIKTGTGTPQWYSQTGKYFFLFPEPDAVYTWKMKYYARGASFAGLYTDTGTNIENVWLKHAADLLIAETGAIIGQYHLQSVTLAKPFVDHAIVAKTKLIARDTMLQEQNQAQFIGPI